MKELSQSTLMRFIISISLLVIGTSLYLQYIRNMEPCPLCLMQRLCVVLILAIGMLFLSSQRFRENKTWLGIQLFFAIAGLYFALRQLWLLSLPQDQIPACVPGLTILIHYFPWKELANALFWGSGDCTEISWKWLGLSLPIWSTLYFVAVVVTIAALIFRLKKQQHAL